MESSDCDLTPCSILQVIQPNLLMIALEDSDELNKKIAEFETKLTAQWDHRKSTKTGTNLPSINVHVAYKEGLKKCRRGIVKNIRQISDVYRYRVILYDHGLDREVELHELMIIRDTTDEISPRCKILQIPGIVPACLSRDIALQKEYREKFVEGTEWTEASLQGAKNWVIDHLKTCQVVITSGNLSNLFVEGDLYTFDERHRLMHKSYSEYLCDNNLALVKIIKDGRFNCKTKQEEEEEETLDWKTQAQCFGGLLADVNRSDPPIIVSASQKEKNHPSSEAFVDWDIYSEEHNTLTTTTSNTTTVQRQQQSLKLKSEEKSTEKNKPSHIVNKNKTESNNLREASSSSPPCANTNLSVNERFSDQSNNKTNKNNVSSPPPLKFISNQKQHSPSLSTTTLIKTGEGLKSTQNNVKRDQIEEKESTKGKENNLKFRSHLFAPVDFDSEANPYAAIGKKNQQKKPSLAPDHINHSPSQKTKTKQKDISSFDSAPIKETKPSNIDKEEVLQLTTKDKKDTSKVVTKVQNTTVSSTTSPNFEKINKEYKQKEATRPQSNPTLQELYSENTQVTNLLNSNSTNNNNNSSIAKSTPGTNNNNNNRVSLQSNSLQFLNRPHSCTPPETQKPTTTTNTNTFKTKDLILPKGGKIKRHRSPESVNKYLKSSKEQLNKLVSSSSEVANSEKSVDESEVVVDNMFQQEAKTKVLGKSTDDEGGKSPETPKEKQEREKTRVQTRKSETGRGGSTSTTFSSLFGRNKPSGSDCSDKSIPSTSASTGATVKSKPDILKPIEIPRHPTVVYQSRMDESSIQSKDTNFKIMGKGRIFVHGSGQAPVPAYKSMQDFPLLETVKPGLVAFDIKKFNCLLNNVIPNIMRGRNCIIVDKEKGGKSLAYIIPTVANIMENSATQSATQGENSKPSEGPVAVFLTASLATGEKLLEYLQELLKSKKFGVSYHFISEMDKKAEKELSKGLDIIIITPECLHQLMEKCTMSYQRLKYFVLDDCDILLTTKIDVVEQVMKLLQSYLNKLGPRPNSLQTICCGTKWTQQLESIYLKVIDNPVACLGEVQAIVFGKIKPEAYYTDSNEEKIEYLIERLKNTIKKCYKVVIFCKEDLFIEKLQKEILDKLKLHAQLLTRSGDGDISSSIIGATLEQWKQASESAPEIIICTDPFVKELQIHDATHIIHFEVPLKPSIFGARFSALWKWLKGPEENSTLTKDALCTVYVTSKETPRAVVRVLSNLKQMKSIISPELDQYYLNIKMELDRNLDFCPGLIWHGQCENFDPTTCKYRHFTVPLEDTARFDAVPKTGEIEVRIVECKSVCSYLCQLVRHYQVSDGKVIPKMSYENYLRELTNELNTFYSKEENRVPVTKFIPKSFLATANEHGAYMRVSVDEMITENSVRVFEIDSGEHRVRNFLEDPLYVLPDHLKSKTRLAIELIIANMKPMLGERRHRIEYTSQAKKLTADKILKGRICLSIGNRIWVDQLVEQKRDGSGKIRNIKSFRPEFFKKKIAEDNPNHMEKLYELFEKGGISCEHYKKSTLDVLDPEFEKECYQLNDEVQWAHLDIHHNFNEMRLWCTYISEGCTIYAMMVDYVPQLEDLIEILNEEVVSFKEKYHLTSMQLKKYYTLDMIVAVKDPYDEKWARGMIYEYGTDSNSTEVVYDVLLVDTGALLRGVEFSELSPIPTKLVKKLPFQAIALNLDHVMPKNSDENHWSPDTFNLLSDYILKDDTSGINAVILSKTKDCMESCWPLCNSYHAMIFPWNEDCEVGEKLVASNHAKYEVEGEKLWNRVQSSILEKINRELNYLNVEDNDSGDDYSSEEIDGSPCASDDDEFDVYVGNEAKALQQFGIDVPVIDENNSKAILPSTPSSSFDGNGKDSSSSEELKIPSTNSPSEFQLMYPGLKSPEIEWKETDDHVLLRVLIPDIKDCDTKIGPDKKFFTFRTIEPSGYGFQIELFKKVEMKMNVVKLGQYTKIIFTKRMRKLNWDHLYNGPKTLKVSRIFHDNDFEDEEEELKKSRIFASLLNRSNGADENNSMKSMVHSVYGDTDSDSSESDYDENLDEIIG